ncbi:MAG: c-type cytochrome [Pseudomonadota bacterium]
MRPSALLALLLVLLQPVTGRAGDALVAEGRDLYEWHCLACHGETGEEGEAGDIRGLSASIVASALRGMEQMPEFVLSEREVDAIIAYLAHLWER